MTPRAEELAITILRIISEGNLGTDATGHFAKLDDIIEEIGDKNDTKNIIVSFLLPKKYIRKINDKFRAVHNHELEYTAYQITQLGKTYLNNQSSVVARPSNFGNTALNNLSQAVNRLDQLIAQADAVIATHTPNPPNMIGFATLSTEKFQQWKASSENIIKTICGPESNYYENFKKETKRGGHKSCVNAGKGILSALKDDIDAGLYPLPSPPVTMSDISAATVTSDTVSLKISEEVYSHIKKYLDTKDYFHAVEESYKVVRQKLREITGKEKASDVFNMNAESIKYHEQIFGGIAEPGSPESDFFRGIGYLNLTIQFLRNEKIHILATPVDENLAIHYISLASLAYDLISRSKK
jgi:uncharacterized protein (TIGR02391 family)